MQAIIKLRKELKYIIRILFKYRLMVLGIFILSIGVSLFESIGISLVFPILEGINTQKTAAIPFPFDHISRYFAGMDIRARIQIVAVLMVLITGLKNIMIYLNSVASFWIQGQAMKYLRKICFEQLMRINMSHFNKQKYGDLATLIVTYASGAAGLISCAATLFPKIFTVVLFVGMLLLLSWQMTIAAIIIVGFCAFLLWGLGRYVDVAGQATAEIIKGLNSTVIDVLMGMKIIRLFNREAHMKKVFNEVTETCREREYELNRLNVLISPLFEFSGVASLALIIFIGSFVLAEYTTASIQILLLFLVVLLRTIPQAMIISDARVKLLTYLPYLRGINAFTEEKDILYIKDGKEEFSGLNDSIEFKGVTFKYEQKDAVILNDLSFKILKGAKVGIVGSSGAGKSTITELLLRFYDPQKGSILVDGIDLKDLNILSWRKRIGVVTQDAFLFNNTIGANISFANPDLSQDEIEDAARRAHIHEFIAGLPDGYDTWIGERGVRLSGGQRQRIAIARAIVLNPEILVFDEATSALDTESERIVQKALDEIGEGKAVITIAHRLSTIFNSDQIIVLDAGNVSQQGPHHELLKEDGIYSKLIQMQSAQL